MKVMHNGKRLLKVPFRQVYVQTINEWIKETIWCHLIIKIWPDAYSSKV